jgi:hypothetical protein
MNREIEFIIYLKKHVANLNRIVKKIDNYRDLTDEDRNTIKATIEAFLRMERNL